MVLNITGMSSNLALSVIDATKDRQIDSMRREPVHNRSVEAFKDRIASITTPEELVADFEVYQFVMKAFDLEDQMFGRAMMRRILESDPSDDASLVNRLTDPRFEEIHEGLGFVNEDGETQIPDFADAGWVDGMVDRYFDQVFVNENGEQNATVGTVLHFHEEHSGITSWYHVLKDEDLTEFFQTALGLPSELSGLEVDEQKRRLEDKFDLSTLSDPAVRDQLVAKYVAISDVLNPPTFGATSVTSLFQSISLSGQFLTAQIDIPSITYSASSLYR